MKTYVLCSIFFVVLLASCNGTSSLPIGGPNQPPTAPETPVDSGRCAYTITEDISVPTTLVNTASACDYLLDGFRLEVSSTLVIEPGVVVQATQDTELRVSGGQILAVGTPQARITLAGLNPITGYWKGIRFDEGRESRFEYVDLRDAGQVCTLYGDCPDAALILDAVAVSLVNTTISNSHVHGLYAVRDVLFTRFESNRFYNNVLAGIVVNGSYVPVLDTLSDYSGGAEPNGTPYILIASSVQTEGREFRWKKLGAPYLLETYFDARGGTLIIDPGVEMVFGNEGNMTVQGNGVLKALGTPAEPILFRGKVEQPGYWAGITFWDSPWEGNKLSYVQIRHSGFADGLDEYGAVRLRYDARVNISNSVISDNAKYGVTCSETSKFTDEDGPELVLGFGNTFLNNAAGDVDPNCSVTP